MTEERLKELEIELGEKDAEIAELKDRFDRMDDFAVHCLKMRCKLIRERDEARQRASELEKEEAKSSDLYQSLMRAEGLLWSFVHSKPLSLVLIENAKSFLERECQKRGKA